VARRLVGRNPALFEKEIRAPRASGQEVVVAGFANEKEEAQWLIADLRREREGTERPWGDFAILYRRHEVGNALESALVAAGIPCRLARGHALQDDPVVRFVLAALRLIVSPDDPVAIERFVELALGDANLMGRLRASAGGGGALLPAMQRQARGLPRGAPERRALWRTIYGLENLAGLAARHTELPDLVDEMLSRRVGPHQTPLEERQDELADPASLPEVVALAEDLSGAMHGRRQVWVNPASGLEIALRGMLFEAGITTVDYLADGREPGPGDLVLTPETRPGPPYVLRLFKALQLVHSRQAGGGLTEFVAFDLETTGHDPDTCEIVEIAAVRVQDGVIVDELHSLIRPRVGVSLRAREVHGYDDADLADAPRFEAVWPRFRAFVGDSVLVAHNGYQFDVPVLLRLARGLEGAGDLTFFDTLPLARAVQTGNAKLESLADRFGISAGRSHHALDDARTLALVHGQLEQARRTIARKTTLSNLLDFLALGLALEGRERFDQEAERIFDPARFYALGPYSECLSYYEQERQFAPGPTLEPVELIARLGGQQLLERLRVERSARDRYPETLARLRPFLEAAQGGCLVERIGHFLERVALATSDGVETDRQRVNLLTLHSTKGLEFPGVYIVGVEDRQLPGKRVLEEQREDELEEARRLLYVGMTRARARLVLTHVAERNGWRWGGTMLLEEMGLSSGSPPPERPPPRGDPMLHPRV
jgi:DNA polymerase III epsilon subunit family exonuclease